MKITLLALAATTALVHAEPMSFRSGTEHTPLLELFTSEGCSSCPPAEAWVGRLRQRADLWKGFVPVVFHVDYWNGLGWRDRFSTKAFSQRQHTYGDVWGARTVYTPEFVLDGAEWRAWSRADSVPAAAAQPAGQLVVVMPDRTTAEVSFTPAENAPRPAQLEFALLATSLETKVRAGENGGKTLRHEFVVVHHHVEPLVADGRTLRAKVTLPATTVAPATALAAWVNRGTGQPSLQATGGWLVNQ